MKEHPGKPSGRLKSSPQIPQATTQELVAANGYASQTQETLDLRMKNRTVVGNEMANEMAADVGVSDFNDDDQLLEKCLEVANQLKGVDLLGTISDGEEAGGGTTANANGDSCELASNEEMRIAELRAYWKDELPRICKMFSRYFYSAPAKIEGEWRKKFFELLIGALSHPELSLRAERDDPKCRRVYTVLVKWNNFQEGLNNYVDFSILWNSETDKCYFKIGGMAGENWPAVDELLKQTNIYGRGN